MREQTDDLFDAIDAAFFTGDEFHDRGTIKEVEFYLGRWERELGRIKIMLTKLEEEKATKND